MKSLVEEKLEDSVLKVNNTKESRNWEVGCWWWLTGERRQVGVCEHYNKDKTHGKKQINKSKELCPIKKENPETMKMKEEENILRDK